MHLLDIDFYCCFFFKQKTAYEMRISDWSSDACSSDLSGPLVSRAKLAAALGSPIPTQQTRPLPSRRAASTVIISSGVQEAVMLPPQLLVSRPAHLLPSIRASGPCRGQPRRIGGKSHCPIVRASCRARVCSYGLTSVLDDS